MIGWYLHHHGAGHLNRLRAIAPHLEDRLMVFSSLPRPGHSLGEPLDDAEWVRLPDDWSPEPDCPDPAEADPTAGGALHWAPLRHGGYRSRMAAFAARSPALDVMVVDVSAEVALFSRLLGLPTVVVTQPGLRTDAPHRAAYSAATAVLAPFPELPGLEHTAPHLLPHRGKTVFAGGLSLLTPASESEVRPVPALGETVRLCCVGSRGGSGITADMVRSAQVHPGLQWNAVGVSGSDWSQDVAGDMRRADVVVITGGLGSVADAAVLRKPAVILPQERPFGEQQATGKMLKSIGLTVLDSWPEPFHWQTLAAAALAAGDSPWRRWNADGAGRRAARLIQDTARGAGSRDSSQEGSAL